MLNVKALLAKMLSSETATPSITVTTGSITEVSVCQTGRVVHLSIGVKKTTATATGGNVFEGVIESKYRPKKLINGAGYYGSTAGVAQLLNTGTLTIRITGAQLAANTTIYVSMSYVI